MNSNFKRHTNRLQFAAILRWVIVVTFLGGAGVSYVYLKIQLHDGGTQQKTLEGELALLKAQNSVMELRIEQLTSHAELQRKLSAGSFKLVPISNQAVVFVHPSERAQQASMDLLENTIHTVSHERRLTTSH